MLFIQRLYTAGLSSRETIAELLPCVATPTASTVDAAFARLVEERDRLTAHIEAPTSTRASLDRLLETNRVHRQSLTST